MWQISPTATCHFAYMWQIRLAPKRFGGIDHNPKHLVHHNHLPHIGEMTSVTPGNLPHISEIALPIGFRHTTNASKNGLRRYTSRFEMWIRTRFEHMVQHNQQERTPLTDCQRSRPCRDRQNHRQIPDHRGCQVHLVRPRIHARTCHSFYGTRPRPPAAPGAPRIR